MFEAYESQDGRDHRIIKDGHRLLPEFLEHHTPCFEEEDTIFETVSFLSEHKPCRNFFVHGPAGSGKTSMIKHILSKLHQNSRNVLCIYVDCWHHSTSMAICTRIADGLGEPVSRRGRASDEIFDRVIELMKYSKTPVLLVLDEIDGLFYSDDNRVLHNIAKVVSEGVHFGIIAISDDQRTLSRLDPRISEGLSFISVEMRKYTKDQLSEILRHKAVDSLVLDSYDDEIIETIADFGIRTDGNARIALEILKNAALHAELKHKQRIELIDVEDGFRSLYRKDQSVSPEERLILDILSNGEKTSSELYDGFSMKLLRSKRQIRNYIQALERKGYVTREPVMKGDRVAYMIIRRRKE